MRWFKHKKEPLFGEIRIKSKFLLLPKKINDEYRWLEFAKYEQNTWFV